MEKMFYGPLWPLPRPINGESILSGLSEITETTEYQEAACVDLIISCSSGNTNDVYLVMQAADGSFSQFNDGTVILSVPPGGTRNLCQAQYRGNRYLMSQMGIDGSDYDEFWVCALMQ